MRKYFSKDLVSPTLLEISRSFTTDCLLILLLYLVLRWGWGESSNLRSVTYSCKALWKTLDRPVSNLIQLRAKYTSPRDTGIRVAEEKRSGDVTQVKTKRFYCIKQMSIEKADNSNAFGVIVKHHIISNPIADQSKCSLQTIIPNRTKWEVQIRSYSILFDTNSFFF